MGKANQSTLQYVENADGTVMVHDGMVNVPDDPANADHPDDDDDDGDTGDTGDTGDGADDGDGTTETADDAGTAEAPADSDPEREAIRARRREERAEKRRRSADRFNNLQRQLADLQRQNADLVTRQSQSERRAVGSDLAQLDSALLAATSNIQKLNNMIAAGTAKGDGEVVAKANMQLYGELRRQETLQNARQSLVRGAQQQGGQSGGQPEQPHPDLIRNATAWAARNKWYNPAITSEDDRLVHALDQQVEADGYDSRTRAYWDELDKRIGKYLPHRRAKGGTMGGTNDGKANSRRVPVTGGGTGSTGSSQGRGSSGGYVITAERVQALKASGDWEDPERRAKMIKVYQDWDRQQKK